MRSHRLITISSSLATRKIKRQKFSGEWLTLKKGFVGSQRECGSLRPLSTIQRFEYWNQRNELVSRGHMMAIRYERQTARKKTEEGSGKYDHLQVPHPWTPEEEAKVDEDCLAEEIRGSNPRYWENVNVGDELVPVVKGIFGLTDMISYCVGATPVQLAAHGVQLRSYKRQC
jgi:hypothetical protein